MFNVNTVFVFLSPEISEKIEGDNLGRRAARRICNMHVPPRRSFMILFIIFDLNYRVIIYPQVSKRQIYQIKFQLCCHWKEGQQFLKKCFFNLDFLLVFYFKNFRHFGTFSYFVHSQFIFDAFSFKIMSENFLFYIFIKDIDDIIFDHPIGIWLMGPIVTLCFDEE